MTIEKVEYYRTDDGQTFKSEEAAIAHEKRLILRQLLIDTDRTTVRPFPDNVLDFIEKNHNEVLEFLHGEDLPHRDSPTPGPKYRHGDQIEAVEPLVLEGGAVIIYQPTDAWNKALNEVYNLIQNGISGSLLARRMTNLYVPVLATTKDPDHG